MPRKEFESFTRLDASDVNTYLMDQSVMTFGGTAARGSAIPTPVQGMVAYLEDSNTIEAYNSTAWVTVANAGTASYNFVQTLYFTSNGTFTKATYPWLRAIRVKCQGGGGGGGGAGTTGANQQNIGGSGAGGNYAESFITDITGLASSVTVTRGAGGAGGAAGNNGGTTGGNSSFGSLVIGTGGEGGRPGETLQGIVVNSNNGTVAASTGDLIIPGSAAENRVFLSTAAVSNASSGGSNLAGALASFTVGPGSDGVTGKIFGGGATGGANNENQGTGRAGAAGGNGIVIVELYA
jgi:hypothetical protein